MRRRLKKWSTIKRNKIWRKIEIFIDNINTPFRIRVVQLVAFFAARKNEAKFIKSCIGIFIEQMRLITCSQHRTLQNIRIPILQIFVFVYWRGTRKHFHWSEKYFRQIKMFSCRPSINKNKDLEDWNSNILEGPMSWTSYTSGCQFLVS